VTTSIHPTHVWRAAEGSRTLHLLDPSKRGTRRSGPRAACGRYPQSNGRGWWFSLAAAELNLTRRFTPYDLKICDDCRDLRQ
jgi:hypothetical protein